MMKEVTAITADDQTAIVVRRRHYLVAGLQTLVIQMTIRRVATEMLRVAYHVCEMTKTVEISQGLTTN